MPIDAHSMLRQPSMQQSTQWQSSLTSCVDNCDIVQTTSRQLTCSLPSLHRSRTYEGHPARIRPQLLCIAPKPAAEMALPGDLFPDPLLGVWSGGRGILRRVLPV